MESLKWYYKALKKFFKFSGRARRKEYWYFVFYSFLIAILLQIIEATYHFSDINLAFNLQIGLLSGTYLLMIATPTLAVTTRRLHDTNRSGWWQLIHFIPIVGTLAILIFALEDSYPGDNRYGKYPPSRYLALFY